MQRDDEPSSAQGHRDHSALAILGAVCLLEVAILYVLIGVDTPLRPVVGRFMENGAGIFTLVMSVVTFLCFTVAGFLLWVERRQGKGTARGDDRGMSDRGTRGE